MVFWSCVDFWTHHVTWIRPYKRELNEAGFENSTVGFLDILGFLGRLLQHPRGAEVRQLKPRNGLF